MSPTNTAALMAYREGKMGHGALIETVFERVVVAAPLRSEGAK